MNKILRHNISFWLTVITIALNGLLSGCTDNNNNNTLENKLPSPSTKPNVLFIAIDDLRPQGRVYGNQSMHTPGLDELAKRGVTFSNAYSNVPVCGASRASVMTGLRPSASRFLYSYTRADEDAPKVPTLAKYFKDNGYYTASLGKIFHHTDDSKVSWSQQAWNPKMEPDIMKKTSLHNYLLPDNITMDRDKKTKRPVPYENTNVPDEAYFDGQIRLKAIQTLKTLSENKQPFFLAVGFLKPHLPFNAPKKYWDLYPPETISLADNPLFPASAPKEAWHHYGELRNYDGIPERPLPVPDSVARILIRGYYASMSYSDAQLKILLQSLDEMGLADNTIIVLWGDHGYSLGNHTLWNKHSPFDVATKTALTIAAPGMSKGKIANGLVELVDLYPTITKLAGLDLPKHLQGKSLGNLLENPTLPGKKAVYPRWQNSDTVRTERYSYTEWRDEDGKVTSSMMYNLNDDPLETVNLVDKAEYQDDIVQLKSLLNIRISESNL